MEVYWRGIGGPDTDPNDPQERKEFALQAQRYDRKGLVSLFFQRLTGQIESFSEGMANMNYRKLGEILDTVDIRNMR
jgi:hypothetical protein